MVRRAKGNKGARPKGKTKAKLSRTKSAAKRRPKKTAIRMNRKSVARKQARPKSKARLKAKRPPARAKKKAATREGGTRSPTVGPTPASPAASKPGPTGRASALSGRAGPRHPQVTELDEYRRSSHDIWERMAPGWEERRDWVWEASRVVGEWMVDRLAPQPGQTLLELAAGAGDTGFAAIARLAGEGRLISTDFSPRMVKAAQRRAAELGLTNIEFRVMDAECMDLAEDSVDGVLCRWGYMLMADPGAALRETRRVLRGRDRLVFSVWAGPEHNLWASIPGGVLVERGHIPRPEPGAPGIFAMADPGRVRTLVMDAGFADPEIEAVKMAWTFDDFDGYWEFLVRLAGGLAVTINALPLEEQQAVRSDVRARFAAAKARDGFRLDGVTLNARTS
jgi:SAM-dependent methyltransferase